MDNLGIRASRRLGRELLTRYRQRRQPSNLLVHGIRLQLGDWVTPSLRRALYDGSYEQPEREVMAATLRPDDRYLELGAGIGFMSACACRIVGPGNAVAFEANPPMAAVANETLRLNGLPPLVVNAMLSDRDGEGDFFVGRDFRASTATTGHGGRQIRVPERSLAEVFAEHRPTYLMIDIEGGEVDVLGSPLPDHVRAVCVETHPQITGAAAEQELLVGMIGQGFRLDLLNTRGRVVYFERP